MLAVNVLSLLLLATSSKCSTSKFDLSTITESDVTQDDFRSVDSSTKCPAWFRYTITNDSKSCRCGLMIEPNYVYCNSTTNVTSILRTVCVAYDNETDSVVAGYCPYNFVVPEFNKSKWLIEIPPLANPSELNDIMCGPLNRTGMLCSKCQDGLGPAVLSFSRPCVKCLDSRYGWLVFLSAALIPTTLLCVVIMVFHIDISSPSMNMFVLMCQLVVNVAYVSPSLYLDFQNQTQEKLAIGVLSFYGIWNLDFFRAVLPPFCISSKMNTLQVVTLDYVVALYPLVLTAVMYYCIQYHDRGCKILVFLWRPFHRHLVRFKRTWNVKGSVVNAFASFVLLSYCKLLFLSYEFLLRQVFVYNSRGETLKRAAVFYDVSFSLFRGGHIPYAILAIAVLIFLVFLPLVYILFYQNRLFKKCLSVCKLETALLSELANVSQRSFKNGINGRSDLRWFAGVYLIFRIACCLAYPIKPPTSNFLIIFISGASALACSQLQPHQKRLYNLLDSIFFAIIGFTMTYMAIGAIAPQLNMSLVPIGIAMSLPLFYFLCLATNKLTQMAKTLECSQTLIEKAKRFYQEKSPQGIDESLPYRLLHSSEYTPLLAPPGHRGPVTEREVHVHSLRDLNEAHSAVTV